MLPRAANNAYSWWWASHIRTKQSKWLDQNLEDMEDKVGSVLKLIQEDGDSFRKRAEMYYKKRPELINFVEESYRAYRALAERYDHISKELQNANHTIATVFPERVQFGMDDDDDDAAPVFRKRPPESFRPDFPKDSKLPVADFKGLVAAATKKFEGKNSSHVGAAGGKVAAASGLNKQEGLEEIDKLQRRILSLQTEKEYVTNMYETSLSKYWELEKEIEELQEKVSSLQDEFGAVTVIENDEARILMAETALKSCREALGELQEKQEKSAKEAKLDSKRIEDAREKLDSLKDELLPNEVGEEKKPSSAAEPVRTEEQLKVLLPNEVGHEEKPSSAAEPVRTEEELKVLEQEAVSGAEARKDLQSLEVKIKEHFQVEFRGSLTVSQMADKIDELVRKVVRLETAVSSQTVEIQGLKTETDDLHAQVRTLEDDKAVLLDNKNELSDELRKMEEKWSELQNLNRSIGEENCNLQNHLSEAQCNLEHLSEKLQSLLLDVEPEATGKSEKRSLPETDPTVGFKKVKSMKPDEKQEEASLDQQEIADKLASVQSAEEISDKHVSVPTAGENADNYALLQTAEEISDKHVSVPTAGENADNHALLQTAEEIADKHVSVPTAEENADNHALVPTAEEIADKHAAVQTAEENGDNHASVETAEETDDKHASVPTAEEIVDKHALVHTADNLHKVETNESAAGEQKDAHLRTSRNENEVIFDREGMDDGQAPSGVVDSCPEVNQEELVAVRQGNASETDCSSTNESEGSLEQQETTDKRLSTETHENIPHPGLQESAVGLEDEPGLRNLFMNCMNDKEKVLLSEYKAVLRDYKEMKKMLTELEARNQTSLLEITLQLNDVKHDNSLKEEEILRLRQKLTLLQEEISQSSQCICQRATNLMNKQSAESTVACEQQDMTTTPEMQATEDEEEMVIPFVRPHTSSPLEEKFRMGIDKLLEENLDFWLRFSTLFSLIQKFDTEVIGLRAEVSNLEKRHKQEGSSNSKYSLKTDVRPTYNHLREVQTELALWLEKSVLMKDELRQRSASLRKMQDEIMKAMKQSAEDDEFTFTSYQVAKFQGEILNMKQENKKVAEELQAGLDHVKTLLIEIERNLRKMGEEFGLSESRGSGHLQNGAIRSRIPLRTFIFGVKQKKSRSIFSFVHPALYRKNNPWR